MLLESPFVAGSQTVVERPAILFDHVETVAPYLVEQILATNKHAARIAWMTNTKIMGRFMTAGFKKRDVLSRYTV